MPDSIDDLIRKKLERLNSVPDELANSVIKAQKDALNRILDILGQLDVKDGNIVLSERNLSIIQSIERDLQENIFNEKYIEAVTEFSQQFNVQSRLNDEYFRSILEEFENKSIYETVLKQSQKNAIELLAEDAFTEVLISPLKQSLDASVVNGSSFADTIKSLRLIIEGSDEIDGRLLSHVKRVAYDGFAISDRNYTNTIATDLGLEFYRYSGGEIADTRCFCDERDGKYFHRKEIEAWGRGEKVGSCGFPWQGMRRGTNSSNIFSFLGGYNCKHSILPVSNKSAPKSVIDRNVKSGNYKPS